MILKLSRTYQETTKELHHSTSQTWVKTGSQAQAYQEVCEITVEQNPLTIPHKLKC